ncbi:MAG: HutD family protein [Ascidiaceihabitans sp.]|uniref:HutD/Ves family protein n=2 Tax=Alphaproteobacteria TaxID=28211 RepID=UPI003299F3D6
MMRILKRADLIDVPWKNGGGITRNIASLMDKDDIVWRLSMADVATPGPFSSFAGLTRILTVIEGNGMKLHSDGEVWPADFAVPVTFDGAAPVVATLDDGPICDFNLMFDPTRYAATAHCVTHKGAHDLGTLGQTAILHIIQGNVTLVKSDDRLGAGDTAMCATAPMAYELGEDACVLVITLSPLS